MNKHSYSNSLKSKPYSDIPSIDDCEIGIESLGLSIRARNCLLRAGVKNLQQLVSYNDEELLSIRNLGENTLREIKEKIKNLNIEDIKNLRQCEKDIQIFEKGIDSLDLHYRAESCLKRAGINTVQQLIVLSDEDLLSFGGIGKRTLKHIREVLTSTNLLSLNISQGTADHATLVAIPWWDFNTIKILGLPRRTCRLLIKAGITTVGGLADELAQNKLWKLRRVGLKREADIIRVLEEYPSRNLLDNASTLLDDENPITVLQFPLETYDALLKARIDSIGDLVSMTREEIWRVENIGPKSLGIIRTSLAAYVSKCEREKIKPEYLGEDESIHIKKFDNRKLEDMVFGWFSVLLDREAKIIHWRYGLDGSVLTLEEIGKLLSITRERVRQIQSNAIRKLQAPSSFMKIRPFVLMGIQLIEEAGGVLNEKQMKSVIEEILEETTFDSTGLMRIALSCQAEITWNKKYQAWIMEQYDEYFESVQECLYQTLENQYAPISANQLRRHFLAKNADSISESNLTKDFVLACIYSNPNFIIDEEGKVGLEKWTRRRLDEMILALRELGEPAHFSVIAEHTNALLPKDQKTTPHNIHAHMSRLPDIFVRVGQGVFGLAEWGLHDDGNLANAAARVLREASRNLHIDEITMRVLETWKVNPGSVRAAIEPDARFVEIKPNMYILREHLIETQERDGTRDQGETHEVEDVKTQIQDEETELSHQIPTSDQFLVALNQLKSNRRNQLENSELFSVGPIDLEMENRIVFCHGKKRKLRRKTFELIKLLMENPGRCISYDEIIRAVWRRGGRDDNSLVDSHIHRLWEVLEHDPDHPQLIKKVEGEGYRLQIR